VLKELRRCFEGFVLQTEDGLELVVTREKEGIKLTLKTVSQQFEIDLTPAETEQFGAWITA
jgi:hypothetical protein